MWKYVVPIIALLISSCNNDRKVKEHYMKSSNSSAGTFCFTDSVGRKFEIQSISSNQFNEWMSEGKLSSLDHLSREFQAEAYRLQSGGVIIVEGSSIALYPSETVLREALDKYRSGPFVRAILDGVNPYGKQFPDNVHVLITGLLNDLGIHSDLNNQGLLIKAVDQAIRNKRTKPLFDKY